MIGTLTVQQMQSLVLAVCGMLVVVIPVLTGVALLAISQFGKVKEALGKVNAINGTIEAHTSSLLEIRGEIADNKQLIGHAQGLIEAHGLATPIKPEGT